MENNQGETLFRCISLAYPSDAAFEREMGLPPKTVSNWRRGRSTTYLKMLPELAHVLGVPVGDLVGAGREEHTTGEGELWKALRGVKHLPSHKKEELYKILTAVIVAMTGEVPHEEKE